MKEIQYNDFLDIHIQVGTIVSVRVHEKSRISAYILEVDFAGSRKTSVAQLTQNYTPDDLLGKQIACVVNFTPKRIAGVKSELLVLAAVDPEKGSVLLAPDQVIQECARVH